MLTALNGIASHSAFRCSYLVSVDEQPEIPVEDVVVKKNVLLGNVKEPLLQTKIFVVRFMLVLAYILLTFPDRCRTPCIT